MRKVEGVEEVGELGGGGGVMSGKRGEVKSGGNLYCASWVRGIPAIHD